MLQNFIQCEEARITPIDLENKKLLRKTDPSQFEEFLIDASRMAGGNASAVVFPQTEKQVSLYLKLSNHSKTPVTIAGNHTGLVGGAIPFGGEVLSTHFMTYVFPNRNDKVMDIIQGKDELTSIPYQFYLKETFNGEIHAVVPPGLRLGEFQKRVEGKNLFYAPDPTESNAFLGATASTNASGARTFKYGSTRSHVHALRILLPGGEALYVERSKYSPDSRGTFKIFFSKDQSLSLPIPSIQMPKIKNAAGYFCDKGMDFIDLWMGSEGTLGMITEIELGLIKKPACVMSGIVFFPAEDEAIHFVIEIRKLTQLTWHRPTSGAIDIRALEYMDKHSLEILRHESLGVRIPAKAQAAIYFEQESDVLIPREELELLIQSLFNQSGLMNVTSHPFGKMLLLLREKKILEDLELALPDEDKAQKNLKEFRHALPVKINEIIGHHKRESGLENLHKVGTDTATPDNEIMPMFQIFKETLNRIGVEYVIFGHIGNNHLHANLLPKNEKELRIAQEAYLELMKRVVKMNGTVSAEHGIGKLKHASLEILYGLSGISQMAHLKKALDPNGILGRGNIFNWK